MNQKQIFVILGGILIAGAIIFNSGGKISPPGPTPDSISQTAANDGATFLVALGENCGIAAKKLRSGELKTSDQAHSWLRDANEKARLEAFKPWHNEVQKAIEADQLATALEASEIGFPAAVKGK